MNINDFKNPSALYRPAPFWSWNDKLDKDELKRQINEMADKGWGGYFMHSRVGLVTGYLSDEWMELIRACVEEAGKTGTYAWLYDEDKWPSGFAGGEVPDMDEAYRSRALVLLKPAELTDSDTVLDKVEEDGQEYFICKRISVLGNPWFNGACYVDLMNPEAVRVFIKCTHERYKEACGEHFGKEIPGIFTDEPCYLMKGHYNVPVLPWSEYLSDYFKAEKGYNIEEHLKELFFDTGDYHKARYDFFDCATRLFMENFTKQYYQWCDENNLIMTGHFMAEDTLTSQIQWIGAAMPHYQFMHWPGIDKLGRHIRQLVTVKQVTSAVDQLGKERAFCEVFGCVGQQVSFYHRKWIADWQAALGISFVNHHLSLYSMRGERKRDYPANLFYQQPWWEDEKLYSDYTGRLSYAVAAGKRKVDILVIHPVGSAWSEYTPLKKSSTIFDEPFDRLSKELAANKLDFHYGDEIIMQEHAKIQDGKIVIGAHSYSTVIVPPSCTLRSSTIKLLEEFVQVSEKDNLIFVQNYPDRIDGEKKTSEIFEKANKANSIQDAINILDKIYKNRISVIDNKTGKNADKVLAHIRDTEEGQLIFIANSDEKMEVKATIKIPEASSLKVMDLMSGELYDVPAEYIGGSAVIQVTFYPAGSLLIINNSKYNQYKESPSYLDSGIEFNKKICMKKSIGNWKIDILEDNILLLNNVTLYLNNIKVLDNDLVAKAWHNHFYKAEDGTPFRAEYTFEALDKINENVFAAVEVAENLDKISINGHEVKPLKTRGEMGAFDAAKSWKDVNFTKVPLNGHIKKGKNVLVLEGKKVNNITKPGCHIRVEDFNNHLPTEIEAVYIVGKFKVADFDRKVFAIDKFDDICDSGDLTASGCPFYAGNVRYSTEILYEASQNPSYLKINDVEAACVNLYINGEYVGVKYWNPYIFDISQFLKEGLNKIEIIAATTLFNVMGPGYISGIKEIEGVSPHTFVAFGNLTEKYELMPFGIGNAVIFEI